MNILAELRQRFASALQNLVEGEVPTLVEMVKPSQDPRFGDYQANCAMPLAKRLGQPPRDVAARIVEHLEVADLCQPPEIAGPGFINLTVRDDWLEAHLTTACSDDRLGVTPVANPQTYVIDYSAPNVAKPMHVGHIRSTVIGDALAHVLHFLGHRVISDNHIGDWGTQFGMIIYGYKHFVDASAYQRNAVAELARLYRLVNRLVDYQKGLANRPQLEQKVANLEQQLAAQKTAPSTGDPKQDKKASKALRKQENQVAEACEDLNKLVRSLEAIQQDPELAELARQHSNIERTVLEETAALHAGDPTNVQLWRQFLPACLEDIDRIYRRLHVQFDHTLGESFYEDRLAGVVQDLLAKGLATESDGAICVFLDGHDTPMIVQKKDGAFLYATTDLATIQYREETWQPDAILYVVDHRQSLHFEHLFAVARRCGCGNTELAHVKFGTVLGEDGRPFKTRSGATVGLDGLLDEAVQKALGVVSENDDAKSQPELSDDQRRQIAEVVGIAALKYADLAQNRESDYVFSYDKMLALNGNTATYMQYAYARVRSIIRKSGQDIDALKRDVSTITLELPAERALGLAILRFAEALDDVVADYRPNQLTSYLFDTLAKSFSTFFEQCPVLKAATPQQRNNRLLLCDLTGRTLKTGLALLGIDIVEKM